MCSAGFKPETQQSCVQALCRAALCTSGVWVQTAAFCGAPNTEEVKMSTSGLFLHRWQQPSGESSTPRIIALTQVSWVLRVDRELVQPSWEEARRSGVGDASALPRGRAEAGQFLGGRGLQGPRETGAEDCHCVSTAQEQKQTEKRRLLGRHVLASRAGGDNWMTASSAPR
ncbi:hypothetical protein H920_18976 [Fukomys damarensis]|uniref:Uncharacterized protein n=1 Tax=Fukomys damarensis TaxID=885580 RepID=A0A091CQT1_FUKDA|nr:hypothetical protein H920_18976 [Fukomys damarensis]